MVWGSGCLAFWLVGGGVGFEASGRPSGGARGGCKPAQDGASGDVILLGVAAVRPFAIVTVWQWGEERRKGEANSGRGPR